jgi:PPM family protein phosphatase
LTRLLAGAATDAGKARDQNEDAVRLAEPGWPQVAERGFLAVVADGMGGHQHGEVASQLAVETLFADFYAPEDAGDASVADRLKRAFRDANEQILAQVASDEPGNAPGTTMVAAAVVADQLTIANVGDSRAYLVRAEAATQITNDHSLVAEQVKRGVMTVEEARESKHRNIITRALGHRPKLDTDIFEIGLLPDDRVVLCTDGVHGLLEPAEIADLALDGTPERASQAMIDLAMERGSTDNVSAAILAFEPSAAPVAEGAPELVAAGGRGSGLGRVLLVLLVIVIIAALVYLYLSGYLTGLFG